MVLLSYRTTIQIIASSVALFVVTDYVKPSWFLERVVHNYQNHELHGDDHRFLVTTANTATLEHSSLRYNLLQNSHLEVSKLNHWAAIGGTMSLIEPGFGHGDEHAIQVTDRRYWFSGPKLKLQNFSCFAEGDLMEITLEVKLPNPVSITCDSTVPHNIAGCPFVILGTDYQDGTYHHERIYDKHMTWNIDAGEWNTFRGSHKMTPKNIAFSSTTASPVDNMYVLFSGGQGDIMIRNIALAMHHSVSTADQVPVFYNAFTKDISSKPFVESMMVQQFSLLRPEHHVFVRSIGVKLDINKTTDMDKISLLRHDETGDEIETLSLLWHYCQSHLDQTVVYLHSKGSYHPSKQNDALRRFLTRGALSSECGANLPSSCNVCSSRMSPLPHPHTPGNMWAARCSYVAKLVEPVKFSDEMNRVYPGLHHKYWACYGTGRYSAEHWVHSHPTVKPCDVSNDTVYNWAYGNVPKDDFEIDLKPAPRYDLSFYYKGVCPSEKETTALQGTKRIAEYKNLHNEIVPKDWWGFNFYNNTNSWESIQE